jgi:hypothetical protein
MIRSIKGDMGHRQRRLCRFWTRGGWSSDDGSSFRDAAVLRLPPSPILEAASFFGVIANQTLNLAQFSR